MTDTHEKISMLFDNLEPVITKQASVLYGNIWVSEHQEEIKQLCVNFKNFLIEKNKRYGDAVMTPLCIFSKHQSPESIGSKIDEKLSRIQNGDVLRKNDTVDTFGYIGLEMVRRGWLTFDEFLD
jgi:hypothetical protein